MYRRLGNMKLKQKNDALRLCNDELLNTVRDYERICQQRGNFLKQEAALVDNNIYMS